MRFRICRPWPSIVRIEVGGQYGSARRDDLLGPGSCRVVRLLDVDDPAHGSADSLTASPDSETRSAMRRALKDDHVRVVRNPNVDDRVRSLVHDERDLTVGAPPWSASGGPVGENHDAGGERLRCDKVQGDARPVAEEWRPATDEERVDPQPKLVK